MSAKVLLVAGARPNYMKIAPSGGRCGSAADDRFTPILVHTGQHYDDSMSAAFFRDLDLPEPHVNLAVGSGSHAEQTARVMIGFEQVLLDRAAGRGGRGRRRQLDRGLRAGDHEDRPRRQRTSGRPVLAHVEAGLRSRDRDMPEEINRVVTDAFSDLLFTTCRDAAENLTREGLPRNASTSSATR